MKHLSIVLAFLLACILVVPNHAQNKKKAKTAKPAAPANRTISARPVTTDNPNTKSEDRIVFASPVIEGDPMIPADRLSIHDLKAKLDAGTQILILDLRSLETWQAATTKIKGARRVAVENLAEKMKSWPKTQQIVAYCECTDDAASMNAVQILKQAGFKNVVALWSGWKAWQEAGYPTEPK